MNNQKIHGVIEYVKYQNDFCFDILDVLESPQNILNHYGIYVELSIEELQMLQKELLELAEVFQTSEMVKLYEKELDIKLMRWLE